MSMRYAGKVVVVTGGGGAIGRALASGFAREGAKVLVADRRGEAAEAAAAAIRAEGGEASGIAVDVADLAALDAMLDAAIARHGGLDVLCNNAGAPSVAPDLFAIEEAEWDRILGVNLKAAFFAAQKAALRMIARGTAGAILNTSSTSAYIASSRPAVPYDASKGGLRQMTVSLAAHLVQHGIRVNAIAPGTIDTEFAAAAVDADTRRARLEKRARERIPMRRPGQPEDLVGAALFLCSEEASYVTGQSVVVDGGILLV
jgi:NAD(P)-dependent dehydrogenase (short-subunit alcohol dehydrogenase family)